MLFSLITSVLFCMESWNDQIQKDQLKNGILISKQIEFSSIWLTIAKLPVIHPYTNYEPPFTLVALACKPDFYVHVQTLPEFNKNQLQLIRVHPFIHPQGMAEHASTTIGVAAEISQFQNDPIFKLTYALSACIHPGVSQDVFSGQPIKILVASPNDGPIKLDWKKLQRFVGIYKVSQSPITVLHILIPDEHTLSLIKHIQTCEDYENVLEVFLNKNENKDENLRWIQESCKKFYGIE